MESEGTPFGRYRLIQLIGRGGMGDVWRALDTETHRVVAVKVLPANLGNDPMFAQRFRREALAAAGLTEPHVVPIHNFGEIDGRLYVDMRLIDGRDLQSIIAQGPIEPRAAVGIIEQIASALAAAHRIGLVHRDVKPSNILVAEYDFAYLIDFGIARAASDSSITGAGSVIGTWAYMAPERINTGHNDPRGDIYALACVLHECLTGSQPFPGNSVEQQIGGHLGLPPPRPSALKRGLPPELDTVIATGMAKNPDDRYSTALEMAGAARAALGEVGPLTRTAAMQVPVPVHLDTRIPMPGNVPRNYYPTTIGGQVSHTDATQITPYATAGYRNAGEPNVSGHPPTGPQTQGAGTSPGGGIAHEPQRKRKRTIIFASSITALIAILGIVITIVLSSSDQSSTQVAAPNSGPFTGTFKVAYGPQLDVTGKELAGGEPAETEVWQLRSMCGTKGCVATAARTSGDAFDEPSLVFDLIGNRWYGTTIIDAPESCNGKAEREWHWIYLREQPNGTLSGEWIEDSIGCYIKRTATFTRTGDADLSSVPDPAKLPPRKLSKALYLHGIYRSKVAVTGPSSKPPEEADYSVDTICLRDGDRCLSRFLQTDGSGRHELFIFENGAWTRNTEEDTPCPAGGTSHTRLTAVFPLPNPVPDPITQLSGGGLSTVTGSACTGGHYDEVFTRTGDDPIPR
ncbi:serine/threonine-protein kinase [Mycobacterium sp. TY815]|uniref:serine/threonine-protein kinase n=1 Tax=Mycobacterium sp. TY815 TaxID=3050581 RepID=UPI00274084E7|nr:serine/threonine-protein kinase [Mycobacterium sp. TY815]MDP7707509.1 serine/threonine-protein kinase [Mycobacterium sp. TY815]